jgi:hypothetical protein
MADGKHPAGNSSPTSRAPFAAQAVAPLEVDGDEFCGCGGSMITQSVFSASTAASTELHWRADDAGTA